MIPSKLSSILNDYETERVRNYGKKLTNMSVRADSGDKFSGQLSDYCRKQLHNVICDIGNHELEEKLLPVRMETSTIEQKLKSFEMFENRMNKLFASIHLEDNSQTLASHRHELEKIRKDIEPLDPMLDDNPAMKEIFRKNELKKNADLKMKFRKINTPQNRLFDVTDQESLDLHIVQLKRDLNQLSTKDC